MPSFVPISANVIFKRQAGKPFLGNVPALKLSDCVGDSRIDLKGLYVESDFYARRKIQLF